MEEPSYIIAPREGVNDDYVRVVEWLVAEGQPVARGQAVGTIETTKATIDVAADRDGYLFPLAAPGDEAPVGTPIAAIAATPERPALREGKRAERPAAASAESAVITAKARPLLERHGLTAADFPGLAVIRTSDVEQLLARRPASSATRPRRFRGEDLDPNLNWDELLERADRKSLADLLEALRRRTKARFNRHVPTGTLLHDRWQLARDHGFGEGTSVYDECLILGEVQVGRNCWIGPFTVLDGQGGLTIGDFVDVGTGAHIYSHNTIDRALTGHQAAMHLAGTTIGNCCFIAPHAIIGPGTTIGDHSFVAAGSYVEGTFPPNSYIAGTPARQVGEVVIRGERVQRKLWKKDAAADRATSGNRADEH